MTTSRIHYRYLEMDNTSADPTDASVLTFNNPRTLPQIIFHFLALRILATLSKKHLGDLTFMRSNAGGKSLALFLVLPTFPLASLICRTGYCFYIACTQQWPSNWIQYIVYLASAALGLKTWDGGRGYEKTEAAIEGNGGSVGLLHGEFSDYTRLRCSCGKKICSRWNRDMFGRLAILVLAFYYCASTLFIYLRRREYTWQFAAHELLTGSPPGQHASEIPTRGMEIITGLDELNSVFALGGCTVSLTALILEIMGWKWQYNALESKKERSESVHLRSIRHSSMDARFELPLAMILYFALAHNSWKRMMGHWDIMPAGVIALISGVCVFMGFRFLLSYVGWALRWSGVDAKNMFLWGIMLVTEWAAIHAFEDLFNIGACLRGGKCPDPLFLYKDSWSDKLWTY